MRQQLRTRRRRTRYRSSRGYLRLIALGVIVIAIATLLVIRAHVSHVRSLHIAQNPHIADPAASVPAGPYATLNSILSQMSTGHDAANWYGDDWPAIARNGPFTYRLLTCPANATGDAYTCHFAMNFANARTATAECKMDHDAISGWSIRPCQITFPKH